MVVFICVQINSEKKINTPRTYVLVTAYSLTPFTQYPDT